MLDSSVRLLAERAGTGMTEGSGGGKLLQSQFIFDQVADRF